MQEPEEKLDGEFSFSSVSLFSSGLFFFYKAFTFILQCHTAPQSTCRTSLPTLHWVLFRPRRPGCCRRLRSTHGKHWVSTAQVVVKDLRSLRASETVFNKKALMTFCCCQTSSWTCSRLPLCWRIQLCTRRPRVDTRDTVRTVRIF